MQNFVLNPAKISTLLERYAETGPESMHPESSNMAIENGLKHGLDKYLVTVIKLKASFNRQS